MKTTQDTDGRALIEDTSALPLAARIARPILACLGGLWLRGDYGT